MAVLYVGHYADGDWEMNCGEQHADDNEIIVLHMEHLVARDPTLREVLDLPAGWSAERPGVGGRWTREISDDD